MARAKTVFLYQQEMNLIHAQSIKSLQEIGIKVLSKPILELLEKNGASVDYNAMVAKIPEKIVDQALESVQKEFTLCARDPKHDLKVPTKTYPWMTTSGLAVFVKDYETGEYRNSTRKDIAAFTRLGDAVDSLDFLWTALTATDVSPLAHGPHELWTTMLNTTKHVQGVTAQSSEIAKVQIELAALIAGGKEELKKRPLFSVIICPIAPLTYEQGSIEAQVELAKAGIPVASMSMSNGGATCPLPVGGILVNINTENLGSIVISQMAAPGSPHIYCSESGPMNMSTGSIDYNTPEKVFLSIGAAQMAKKYNLTSLVADGGWGDGIEASVSGLFTPFGQLAGIMGGSDLATGYGCVDSAKGISFEQFIVDSYMWDCSKNYMNEVEISEEKIGLDAVKEVGHGRDFLMHPHTLKYLRGELSSWEREKLDLLEMDEQELPAEANKIVKGILDKHQVEPIAKDLIEKGDAIIAKYEDIVND
ncbi:MAG: trimethylamine methyltransferase family protein [Candidatus Marinimicrobia bacterium]|jgi:trimethylamine--corrinoid protein Co-methyltransferase|nr:trimethylamine methyltransferase family protein [Candidatus Neomarinimicrobiota bacterium]MDP6578720.1 trimethylamine methyltransferase family protein [Candidatus Neomarinimicrobiota bacterium]MDP7061096.1 trimethylamine methyltransferase family protein [Candidatus Neomarinimicrobiota bacterium]|tara:strand:- start:117 stop:1547 length:1431 start_codon:yes stop_codon:yes gene_type:complete